MEIEDSISGRKRQRAVVACTSCRRRKIRCDSTKPQCSNCVRAHLSCEYPVEGRRKRNKIDPDDRAEIERKATKIHQRLDRVENLLHLLLDNGGIKVKKGSRTTDSTSSVEDSDWDATDDTSNEIEDDLDDLPSDNEEGNQAEEVRYSPLSGGSATDDPRDILSLKARRAPVIHSMGDLEPMVAYSYGFTLGLLSPKSMRWLCSRIGNDALGRDAEILLNSLWKKKSEKLNCYSPTDGPIKPIEPKVLAQGLEMFESITSDTMDLLLDKEDMKKISEMCNPSNDLSKISEESPYSIVYPTLVLIATSSCYDDYRATVNDEAPVIDKSVREMRELNKNAYRIVMKKVSELTWHPSTFLLLRLLLLVLYVLSSNSSLAPVRSMLSVAFSRCLDLGLHRGESARNVTAKDRRRRALVWALVQDLDVKMASVLSMTPLMNNFSYVNTSIKSMVEPSGDLGALVESMELNQIYADVYNKIFSPRARKLSVKQMLLHLVKIDKKLNDWYLSLPKPYQVAMELVDIKEKIAVTRLKHRAAESSPHKSPNDVTPGSDQEYSELTSKEAMEDREQLASNTWLSSCTILCYYNIRLLIASIPAFSPSCLKSFENDPRGTPQFLSNSIESISHLAKDALKFAFNSYHLYSMEFLATVATNSFSAMFLKQIRDPRHHTNSDDLIQIYRYITRFKNIAEDLGQTEIQSILNIWLIFASALTQLNKGQRQLDEELLAARARVDPNSLESALNSQKAEAEALDASSQKRSSSSFISQPHVGDLNVGSHIAVQATTVEPVCKDHIPPTQPGVSQYANEKWNPYLQKSPDPATQRGIPHTHSFEHEAQTLPYIQSQALSQAQTLPQTHTHGQPQAQAQAQLKYHHHHHLQRNSDSSAKHLHGLYHHGDNAQHLSNEGLQHIRYASDGQIITNNTMLSKGVHPVGERMTGGYSRPHIHTPSPITRPNGIDDSHNHGIPPSPMSTYMFPDIPQPQTRSGHAQDSFGHPEAYSGSNQYGSGQSMDQLSDNLWDTFNGLTGLENDDSFNLNYDIGDVPGDAPGNCVIA